MLCPHCDSTHGPTWPDGSDCPTTSNSLVPQEHLQLDKQQRQQEVQELCRCVFLHGHHHSDHLQMQRVKQRTVTFTTEPPKFCGREKQALPSALCCFNIMHIRTAAYWIGYAEMLWITTQLSFWTAQLVIGTPLFMLGVGYASILIQMYLVYALCKNDTTGGFEGTKTYDNRLVRLYLVGITARIIIILSFLFLAAYVYLSENTSEMLASVRSAFWMKVLFATSHLLLMLYAAYVAKRCHTYIQLINATQQRQFIDLPIRNGGATNVDEFTELHSCIGSNFTRSTLERHSSSSCLCSFAQVEC